MRKKYSFHIIVFLVLLMSAETLNAQTPGGVSTNLKFWLKADAGVTGTNVSAWADQAGNGINFTQATAGSQPLLINNSINNHPAVNFTNDVMNYAGGITGTGSISDVNIYSVIRVNNSAGNTTLLNQVVPGGAFSIFLPFSSNGLVYWRPKAPDLTFPFANIPNNTQPHIYSFNASTTAGQTHGGTIKNAIISDGKVLAAGTTMTSFTGGANNITLGNAMVNDDIAEVIGYTGPVNAAQNNQIQSYLALKYGITLDQTVASNYVNSSGVIWYPSATSNSGFAKDVTGIVRDDGSGLNQTDSRSINIGSVVTIESPAALNNGDYFIAGDNGASIDLRSSDVPAGYGKRLQRVWRVSKSAGVTSVDLKFDLNIIAELLLSTSNLSNVALLVNNSNSFAASTPVTGTLSGKTLEFTGVTLNDGDYFTLNVGDQIIPTTYDFEFWFGVPSWNTTYFTPQKLHLTGVSDTQSAAYVIDMPADPSFTPITGFVAPNTAKIIDMSSLINSIAVKPANTIQNKGLRIRVNGQMGAYYANENDANYGTMPLRGPNGLGTSFIIPGQDTFTNTLVWGAASSMFVVTATQNNTIVTITPSQAIVGHGANVPFTITLNQGQSYSAQASVSTGNHLSGSFVSSTKPVVVTYMDDLLGYGTSADNAGDQLVPVAKLGLEYVHLRANLNTGGELAYIFGSEDGTTVTIFDGTTTTTLVVNKGGFVKHLLPVGKNAASIIADKPVMVYKIGGYATELGGGILTPIGDCKGTKAIAFQYPTAASQATFSFVAPDAIVGGFTLNGNSTIIQAFDFTSIPGIPGWKYCIKTVTGVFTPGEVVSIKNTSGKFYFYQNAATPGGGDYSNFSDFGNVVLFPTVTHVCGSNTITLNSGAIPFNVNISGYSWSGPNGFTSTLANPVITNPTAANIGTYTVTVTDENNCTYTEKIIVDLPVTSVVVTPTPSAPCIGSTVQFTSVPTLAEAVPASILWSGPNGFTSTQANFEITGITAAQAGTYTCTYTDKYGCIVSKSTTITVSPSVVSSFTIGGQYKISCANPSVTLNVTGFTPGIKYEAFNPYDAPTLFASSNFSVITQGFYNQQPNSSGIATQMNLAGLTGITGASTAYGVKYKGFINITTAGNYTFYTNSKDGSTLSVDGSLLISNDGSHALTEVASTAVSLSAGYHAITVNYFNGSVGTAALTVSYSGPSIAKQAIPASVLFYAGGTPPALTYDWSTGDLNTSSITVSTPGTYTVTGSNGGCSSVTSFEVISIDSYDYSDANTPWPVAQAKIISCVVAGVPSGSNGAVWAGTGISVESAPLRNADASADTFDDGLLGPTTSGGPFNVRLSSNTPGTTVHYGLWFDWNNNGNFADDVDGNGNPAFYNGSAIAGTSVPITVLQPAGAAMLYKTRLVVTDIPVVFTAFDDIFANGEVEDYNSILSLTGSVFDDGNGLAGSPANMVNGTGTNAGGLTAILVNSGGTVVANAAVAGNGVYSFSSLAPDTYSIVLSTTAGTIGAVAPGSSLPSGWANTGENLGTAAGHDGTVNGILTGVTLNNASVTNANFGINSRPTANAVSVCGVDPGGVAQVSAPILTGADLEDGAYNGSSSTNTVTIITLPVNGVLYYNLVSVTAGQIIPNYNPNLLTVDPDPGANILTFTYTETDAAGLISLPATATVSLAYAGADQSANLGGSATMGAAGTGVWTAQGDNPGTAIITTPTDPNTTITGFSALGTYNFIWTNSNGCSDAAKVNVPTASLIEANDDSGSSVNGAAGGVAFTNVLSNDKLNGVAFASSMVNISFVSSTIPGITLSGTNVVVAPNTPLGNYTLVYRICEVINSTNCDIATVTVPVSAVAIDAIDDDYTTTPVNGASGGVTASVLDNDLLNGVILTPSAVTLTAVSVPSGLSLNANGTVTIAAGTAAGSYTLSYRICENLNPGNCDMATATIVVSMAPIDALDDDYTATPVNGANGGVTAPVLDNDLLNGVILSPSAITLTAVSVPLGLSLNADGTVTVAAGTSAGSYTLSYRICENLNPGNCDMATATIVVSMAPIDAIDNDYTATPVNGASGGVTASVLDNDLLNGVILSPSAVTLTAVSVPSGLSLNANGTVTIAAGTSAGSYTLSYRICENLNPGNCDMATATIVVSMAPIDAIDNDYTATPVNGASGGVTASVLGNDLLNGVILSPSAVTLTAVSVPSGLSLNANGTVTIAAGTAAGSYTLSYRICENLNPGNCDMATATIVVSMAPIDAIDNDYTATPVNGASGGVTASVLGNDLLNGVILSPSAVTLTAVSVPSGLSLNANGTVTIAAGTSAGSYTLSYRICENLNPGNCDMATATIVVSMAPIDAIDNDYTATPVNGASGGVTASVLGNDLLNGGILSPSAVTLTAVSVPSGLSLNANGTVTIAAGTSAGSYTLRYRICENLNPGNCDMATATIVVSMAPIDAIDNDYTATPVNGASGGVTASVLGNDLLNGVILSPSAVTLTAVSVPSGLSLNANGTVTIAAGTSAGSYTLSYRICENLNPGNCDMATATIVVSMAPIDAIDDNYTATPVNGASGGVTASVLGNDLLNGGILSPSAVTLTAVSVPSGLSLNADGTVTIAAGTAAGSYTLRYRICENLNPGNCDMATATIVVSMAPIDAIDNDYTATPVNGASGGVTASVLGNDLLNGVILSPSAVTLTAVSVPSGLSLNANGTVSIAAGTAAGSYTLSYRICENLNSGNCDIAEATVFVIVPSIALVKTAAVSSDGMRIAYSFVVTNTGNVTLSNVVLNDPRLGVAGRSVSAILAPGASSTVTINYTISQADRDAKGVTNTATVNAASPDGISVSDVSGTAQNNSTPTFTEISSTPAIALVKTAAVSPDGNSVSYNFVITNTGNITLNGISLTDTKLGISSRTIAGTLAPGQSTSITVIYTTTAADKTANLVTNTAKVDAVAIGGGAVSDVSGTAQNNDNPTVVVLFDGEVLDIPSLFTPNGDGRNDRFEIRGLDQYLENELIIVNRWGNEVYKQSNYKNDWLGEGLNEGTYYYVLRVKKNTTSGWRTYKGYITLLRTSN